MTNFVKGLSNPEFAYAQVNNMTERKHVYIKEAVYKKYRFLCNIARHNEWIGIIFYNVVKEGKNEILEVFDMLPLSIDNPAHTSSNAMEKIVPYIEKHDLLEVNYGLIHSHNKMDVFFSGEDLSELRVNAQHYSQYLSIIVNVFDEIIAKVAVHAEAKTESFISFLDSGRKKKNLKVQKTESVLLLYDCDITFDESLYIDNEFEETITKLKFEAVAKAKAVAESYSNKTTQVKSTTKPSRIYATDLFIRDFMLSDLTDEEDTKKFATYSPIGILYAVCRTYVDADILRYYGPEEFIAYVKNKTTYSDMDAYVKLYVREFYDFLNGLFPSEVAAKEIVYNLTIEYAIYANDVKDVVSFDDFNS